MSLKTQEKKQEVLNSLLIPFHLNSLIYFAGVSAAGVVVAAAGAVSAAGVAGCSTAAGSVAAGSAGVDLHAFKEKKATSAKATNKKLSFFIFLGF